MKIRITPKDTEKRKGSPPYDIDGYRIEKENKEGELTHFVFDVSGKILEEINVESSQTISSVFLKSRRLARVTSDETLYYGTGHKGTTVLMTDEAGVKVWTSEATPFGDAIVTKTGDRDDLALKYTGKDLDKDTGLYYYNARWYDAGTGRFISEDPARDGSNWYIYVSNNPLKYIDPTGMRIDDDLDEDLYREYSRTNPGGSQNSTPDDGGGNGPEPKPEDKDKPTIKPQDGQPPVVTPGKGELPEDVIKALKEAGIPMTGENPTLEDLDKALQGMKISGADMDQIKSLFNEGMSEFKEMDIAWKSLALGTIEVIGGISTMIRGIAMTTTIVEGVLVGDDTVAPAIAYAGTRAVRGDAVAVGTGIRTIQNALHNKDTEIDFTEIFK